jgi:hypothetical protein
LRGRLRLALSFGDSMKSTGDKVYFQDSISLPNDSGTGILLGRFEDGPVQGALSSNFGWRDITSDVSIRGVSATDPTFTQVGSTAFRFYRFAIDKLVWFNFHVPHDYVPSSPIHFHVHWFTEDAATGFAKWQWTYAYAKGFNQEAFDFAMTNSPLTTANVVTATQASGGAMQHMIAETEAVTIPGLTEPDGMICVQLKRIAMATSPASELSSAPYMLTSDIHYRSTNLATLQKAPNFYADS